MFTKKIVNQAPRPKGRGMNCASPNSRSSTGLRRERRGIRPKEIEVTAETAEALEAKVQ
jgi:hypothetical protein